MERESEEESVEEYVNMKSPIHILSPFFRIAEITSTPFIIGGFVFDK